MTTLISQSKGIAITLSAITLLLSGCSGTGAQHRPIVDGGNLANYETDLRDCQTLATKREYFNQETKTDALAGAAVGGLLGVLESSEDAVGGALVGATIGGASSAYEVQDERKRIVINCMAGRGYNVVE